MVNKKKKVKKKTSKKSKTPAQKIQIQMQPILVDNFVSLQKVMINLASKLDNLTTKIEKLLKLFELSAKKLAKKDFSLGEENPEIIKRLKGLSEQNKIIARGMTLMHEEMQKPPRQIVPPPRIQPPPTQVPPTPQPPTAPTSKPEEEYKKSSNSNSTKLTSK